jgi:adenosylcobinamide-phosphate synthase
MSRAIILVVALLLDRLFGDPHYGWHPVRLIGKVAIFVEKALYRPTPNRIRGAFATFFVLSIGLIPLALVVWLAQWLHPIAEFCVGSLIVYVSMAPADLAAHARRVAHALRHKSLEDAQTAVGAVVGRDTDILDAPGVCRAAVEAVAESTVDGVIAPLFWACFLGPLGAFAYRVVNTLDSLWGHRDERYEYFGTVAARTDDVANYIPARVTLLFIAIAAFLIRANATTALRLGISQGSRHQSPNSGISEAAFAGALGVTLGGTNRYDGQWHQGPTFGSVSCDPTHDTIDRSIKLMWFTTSVAVFIFSTGWLAFDFISRSK